jgi:PHD/YefM family antitoxin component YafN of YafNO toxin-antitoxin module
MRSALSLLSECCTLSAPYLLRWTARKRAASFSSLAQAKFNSGKTIGASRMTSKRYVVDEKGERKAVIIPIEEYEKLIEDLHDLAVIAERRDEPTVPLDEIIEKLKKNGILPSST